MSDLLDELDSISKCPHKDKPCRLLCIRWMKCADDEKKGSVRIHWSISLAGMVLIGAFVFYLLSQGFTGKQLFDFSLYYLLPIGSLAFLVWVIFRRRK